MYRITNNLRLHFDKCCNLALEKNKDEINDCKITVETTIERLREIRRFIDLY